MRQNSKINHIILFYVAAQNNILCRFPYFYIDFHEFPCHPYMHDEGGTRGTK